MRSADKVHRGPPLAESFERFYGLSRAESERAVAYYRERFTDTGIFENRVIDGIPALLDTISDAGAKLALATSKPQVFAERILNKYGLSKPFSVIVGSAAGTAAAPTRQRSSQQHCKCSAQKTNARR